MTTQAFILMAPAEADAALELNNGETDVAPQTITNTLANNLGYGTIVGQFVLPARLLNDPDYSRLWAPLGSLPIHVMDSETLFTPVSDE